MYIVTFELKTSLHVLGEHNGTKTEFYRTNTKSQGLIPAHICIDNNNYYYCCACGKTSISINKYMQNNCALVGNSKYSAMYTVFIIMCKTILSTEVQGPSLTSEWNAAMAPSIGTVLVRVLAIASLFFRFLCNFTCNVSEAHMLAMRVLFCSSLSKVCSCVSEPLMLAMRLLFFSCLRNVHLL